MRTPAYDDDPLTQAKALDEWSAGVRDFRSRHSGAASLVSPDLDSLFEELDVANEELRTQHEALLASSVSAERDRAMYGKLFDAAPLPYLATDGDGAIRAANAAAAAILGVRVDRLVRKPLAVFIAAEQRAAFRATVRDLIATDGTTSLTLDLVCRDGVLRRVPCVVGATPPRRSQAGQLRWLLLDEQVTEGFERELLLAEAQAGRVEAERADEAKSHLLATVSHELRTPLAAIGGYVELLELGLRGPLTDEQRADIQRIRGAQEHMQHLLDDLLLYFRLGFNGLRVETGRVSLADLVTGLSSFVAPQANQRRISIQVDPLAANCAVLADVDRARQILINLLTNAVKFSPDGSTVTLSTEYDDEQVRIVVQDSGPGISLQHADAVFEPFVQAGPAGGRGGFGLGLAISRKLAELMGGSLTLRSSSAHGSTFSLTLRRR